MTIARMYLAIAGGDMDGALRLLRNSFLLFRIVITRIMRDITATVLHHLFPVRDVCRCGSAYPERFFLSGLQVVKVGINFDVEKHTLGDYINHR